MHIYISKHSYSSPKQLNCNMCDATQLVQHKRGYLYPDALYMIFCLRCTEVIYTTGIVPPITAWYKGSLHEEWFIKHIEDWERVDVLNEC